MTLHETVKALHGLSLGGWINHEKLSLSQFESMIKTLFNGSLKLGNAAVVEIALPDGWWLCKVIKYSSRPDGWSYEIPETREQEKRIWDALTT